MPQSILLKRSNVKNSDGSPKLPDASVLQYGELAVNYAAGAETISIKNSNDEIVTFSSDNNSSSDDSSSIYSITIDQTVSDPYHMISSGDSREVIEWIRKNSHRYLGTYVINDDIMYLCQLDDYNSTNFSDGETATLTGEQGDVFMKLPKFYYKAENIGGNNWKVSFSLKQIDSTWKCWEGNDLIGAFEAIYENSKLRSIKSSSYASRNISWTDFRMYARNRYGDNHGKLVTWEQHCMMAFLYYAYYCHTNSQEQCGYGYDSNNKSCGSQLSMIDTTYENGNTELGINFWGLENWWSGEYEFMDNVSGGSNYFTITTYNGTTGEWGTKRTTTAYNVSSYIRNMTVGEYLDASSLNSTKASDSTGYCDYFGNKGSDCIVLRSDAPSNRAGGVANSIASNSPSYTNSTVGSRLSYVGPCTLLTSNEYINKLKTGVFIQDIDGNLYTTSEWDDTKTPNGIAVSTENVKVLLALTETTAAISNSSTDKFGNYTTGTTSTYTAMIDYNGRLNTANIIKLNDSIYDAAGWCDTFIFPNGKTKGYLPSLGELWEIYQNKSAVDAALSACGGTAIDTFSDYWSSTFYGNGGNGSSAFWTFNFNSGRLLNNYATIKNNVRAVASIK